LFSLRRGSQPEGPDPRGAAGREKSPDPQSSPSCNHNIKTTALTPARGKLAGVCCVNVNNNKPRTEERRSHGAAACCGADKMEDYGNNGVPVGGRAADAYHRAAASPGHMTAGSESHCGASAANQTAPPPTPPRTSCRRHAPGRCWASLFFAAGETLSVLPKKNKCNQSGPTEEERRRGATKRSGGPTTHQIRNAALRLRQPVTFRSGTQTDQNLNQNQNQNQNPSREKTPAAEWDETVYGCHGDGGSSSGSAR